MKKLLIYGDSISYGYLPNEKHEDLRLPLEERYYHVLEKRFSDYSFFLEAKVGRCIPELPFEWEDLQNACKNLGTEDKMILFLGINDYLSFGRPDGGRVIKRLREFFQDCPRYGIPFPKENILYIAPPSLSFPGDRYYEVFSTLDGEWNRELENFCREEAILCFSPFSLELPRFPDRVHLLPEGQIKLGEALLQFIEEKQFLKS